MSRIVPIEPEGLPQLSRGAHSRPEDGVCLMELVACLAGAPHSDAPSCTHPVLAAVARVVNDGVSEEGRRRLAGRAPELVDTADTSRLVTAKLVLSVCELAFFAAAPLLRPRILRAIRQARRTLRRADLQAPSTPRELRFAASAAATAAAALTIATGSNRDDVLVDLLADALATYHAATRRDPDQAEIVGELSDHLTAHRREAFSSALGGATSSSSV
jgi:hypothetical protein